MAETMIASLLSTGSFPSDEAPAMSAGNVRVDVARYQAFVAEKPVTLTYQEFELLRLLVGKPNRIVRYDELIVGLWRDAADGSRRRLGVVICRLRAKLSGASPYRIQTVRGRGYGLLT
ncbi:MAG: winged helix-turn-helix domain-containing protein [Dehalococcoidia bacterium]